MENKYGILGILGGMGPEATNNIYKEIIKSTPAKKDQEHIPVIMYSNPQIPDRTTGILYGGENPFPALLQTAEKLKKAGSDFIIIPCNTSHYFIDDLRRFINIPIISMIEETVLFVRENYPHIKKIGLLATTGTIKTEIYNGPFKNAGIELLTPNVEDQECLVMEAIYGNDGIKAGKKNLPTKLLQKAANTLFERGAEAIILGCTEIPLALNKKNTFSPLINPTKILANRAVDLSTALNKKEAMLLLEIEEEEE